MSQSKAPKTYTYDYPRPELTVDVVAFASVESKLHILLIRRREEPYAGSWALPGGFLEENEVIERGVLRELREETGLDSSGPLIFLNPYGDPGRDPRAWTISLAYMLLVPPPLPEVKGTDDATIARWHEMVSIPELAFDHAMIVHDALECLLSMVDLGDRGVELLPKAFTMADIERLFRSIGETPEEAEHWRDYMLDLGRIEPVPRSKTKYRKVVPQ